ncbi:S49 family peptidase [Thiocystis violacea]|uniref:S49 family peptidase n=1 Tax=Thiocystis violacea TaxID=13725 RepID=UPI0019074AD1|nr:S49 family peptidase [Thiocystis violacea]
MNYPHLAARIFNTPLLIHPAKLDAIIAGLGGRLLGTGLDHDSNAHTPVDAEGQPLPAELFSRQRGETRYDRQAGTYYQVQNGVALIDIHGALAHRTKINADSTAIIGYQEIARNIEAALADSDVGSLLLSVDSPGGEVSGAFELAALIREADARKPVHAIADSLSASAGYLIVSGARTISVAPTGYVGSIGVVMTHVDVSRALANDGVAVTHIYAGAHKVDGTPYQPLPDAVRERFQAEIDDLYRLFVQTVAESRGLDPARVLATQAGIFRAQAAVDAGLANRIATQDFIVSELAAQRPRSFPVGQPARATVSTGAKAMTDTTQAGASNQPAITEADLDAAHKLGAEAERTRIFAILDSAAAQERPQAALALARKGAIDSATAADVLASLPTEFATLEATAPTSFERHMASLQNPRLAPDGDETDPDLAASAAWATVVARYAN